MEEIRGIKVNLIGSTSSYKTIDDLKCDICGKKVNSVIATICKGGYIGFACFKDSHRQIEETFLKHNDKYMYICEIEDIGYSQKKETKKRVRSGMTLKLRYKIMKRDNFKCTICGSSMPDVELCVDHILPVCKGGSNVESNLRTLCFKCNAGKGGD